MLRRRPRPRGRMPPVSGAKTFGTEMGARVAPRPRPHRPLGAGPRAPMERQAFLPFPRLPFALPFCAFAFVLWNLAACAFDWCLDLPARVLQAPIVSP
jgi:hypothetical protein